MFELRDWLRAHHLMLDWRHIGVPWIMTEPGSYAVIVMFMPMVLAVIVAACFSASWLMLAAIAITGIPVMWLLQFFIMQ